jgi:hypothetical protein
MRRSSRTSVNIENLWVVKVEDGIAGRVSFSAVPVSYILWRNPSCGCLKCEN